MDFLKELFGVEDDPPKKPEYTKLSMNQRQKYLLKNSLKFYLQLSLSQDWDSGYLHC